MLKKLTLMIIVLLFMGSIAMYAAENHTYEEEELAPIPTLVIKPVQRIDGLQGFQRADAVIYSDYRSASYLNVFEMIVGRVAGVSVMGGPGFYRVRVRGAMGPPLLVIDNMPFFGYDDRALNDVVQIIPPQDVDYIEIIKNVANAAIYGRNAGNGVIVVHTRRGGTQGE